MAAPAPFPSLADCHTTAALRDALAAGANPNGIDSVGRPALVQAATTNDTERAQVLLDAGADPNAPTPKGTTALLQAIQHRNTAMVELLLNRGANPNQASSTALRTRMTPLMWAVRAKSVSMAALLLAHGADPNAFTANGDSALSQAAALGDEDLVRLLLPRAAPDLVEPDAGIRPLCLAAAHGHLSVCRLLQEAGANPHRRHEPGITALEAAAQADRADVVRYLVNEVGVDVHAVDADGTTVLMRAALMEHPKTVAVLLELGANPLATDHRHRSALEMADTDDVRGLLQAAIDKNALREVAAVPPEADCDRSISPDDLSVVFRSRRM